MRFLLQLFVCVLVFSCFLFTNTATAQMRQVHIDTLQDGSDILELSFYSASEGYVAFKYRLGFTSDSGRTFTYKNVTSSNVDYNGLNVNLTFGFNINGVKAFDHNNVIVTGHYGGVPSILYSTNGGDSYTLAFHSQYAPLIVNGGITSMAFPQNGNIGYASDPDRILKTVDRGLTWSIIRTLPGSNLGRITAINSDTLYLIGNGNVNAPVRRITKSLNGGTSWTNATIPGPTVGTLNDIFFLNGRTGWVSLYDTAYNGYFYKTTNGGANWILMNDIRATSFISNGMRFLDANTGYALLAEFNYRVYKTVNGGILWEPLPRDNDFEYTEKMHYDMDFYSPTQFWAGGGEGFIELTTNAGGTPLPKAYFKADTTGVSETNSVQLRNYSNTGYQYTWYVNNAFVANTYNAAYSHNPVRRNDTIVLIVSNGIESDTVTKVQRFYVPPFPVINSFFPLSGGTGTFVTIKGKNFTTVNVTGAQFGGSAAAFFTILTDTTATAIVGNGLTGVLSFSDARNVFSSTGIFTYLEPSNVPPPVVTYIQPSSGPVGTAVTITGNNFGSDNIVYFGAVRAQIVSSTQTQINCIVPAGATYKPLSVLNTTTHLTATSFKPFNVTFADSSNFTSGSLINACNITYSNPSNFSPYYMKARDINNDGKPDLVIRQTSNGLIEAYKNTSNQNSITFGSKNIIGTLAANDHGQFDVNDVDGDGLPDIAAPSNRSYFYILKNNSNPDSFSFSLPLKINIADGSQDAVITDLDNDGRNDIAIASYNTQKMSVLKNTGSPGNLAFGQIKEYACGGYAKMIAAGDLDGDGKKEIVTLNYHSSDISSISCFHNTSSPGNIMFDTAVNFIFSGIVLNSQFISIVDYDNDGRLDIVAVNSEDYLHVFRNTGSTGNSLFDTTGNANLKISVSRAGGIDNISGDSKPDCMFASEGGILTDHFAVVRNVSLPGNISNDQEVNILPPAGYEYAPYAIDAGDFDLDGKTDIVICSAQDKGISIYKNNVGRALPQSICANAGAELLSDITGASYQWQQDTGTGYHSITNNIHFSDVNSSVLQLNNIPSSWSEYSYRCLVDNSLLSQSYKLKFTNTWIGNINSNWNNPASWSCQVVPDEHTNVIIRQATVNVNANAVCRTLSVTNNGNVIIAAGFTLQILR